MVAVYRIQAETIEVSVANPKSSGSSRIYPGNELSSKHRNLAGVQSACVTATAVVSARWKRRSVEGFRTMALRTRRPGRMKQRTNAGDCAIGEAEAWRTLPRAVEDQQLLLNEHGFSHDGPNAAGPGERTMVTNTMQQKGDQLTHRGIVARSPDSPKCARISVSLCTGAYQSYINRRIEKKGRSVTN